MSSEILYTDPKVLRVAHFCSGSGSTMANVAERALKGELGSIRPALVVASKEEIGAIDHAIRLGIPYVILDKTRRDVDTILSLMSDHRIHVLSMNGWLPILPSEVTDIYGSNESYGDIPKDRISMNQHPGILRAGNRDFGGADPEYGMFGSRVTAARILYLLAIEARGDNVWTESSVHIATGQVDGGRLVGVSRLDFGSELDNFRNQSGIRTFSDLNRLNYNDPSDPQIQMLRDFVSETQKQLLPLEHKNVGEVLTKLGENGIAGASLASRLPTCEVYQRSGDITQGTYYTLQEAKRRACMLFPKG